MRKVAIHAKRRGARTISRPAVARPQRPAGLGGAVVRSVVESKGSALRHMNGYLVLLHVTAGMALLAFCLQDILEGGPSRPMIIPILGAYMSVSVVFHAVLKEKSPTVLVWINGLSDVVFIVAAHRLAVLGLAGLGADLTIAVLIGLAAVVYGTTGEARLVLVMSAIVTSFFCFTLISPATGYPVLDARATVALLVVAAAAATGYRIARVVQKRQLGDTIRTLEHIDAVVTTQRLRHLAASPLPAN